MTLNQLCIFILSFTLLGCGKGSADLSQTRLTPQNIEKTQSLIEQRQHTIILEYSESFTADSCEITDLINMAQTSPCACVAGVCTAGLTPSIMSVGSYSYKVFSGAESSNSKTIYAEIKKVVPFVSTWRVGAGDLSITLPLPSGYDYDFTVNWGDGSSSEVTSYNDSDITHAYSSPGDYDVEISGLVNAWSFNGLGDKDKLLTISELGTVGWKNLSGAFNGCTNLTTVSGGDTSQVKDMSYMFYDAVLATPDTSGWATSNVTDMSYLFYYAQEAIPDTSGWDVSKVTDLSGTFGYTNKADPDVSNWDTSNVVYMTGTFGVTNAADPDVSLWNTSKVTEMDEMFEGAIIANPDVSNWDVSNVIYMYEMFNGASLANPDPSNWNLSSIEDMFFFANGSSLSTANYDSLLIQLELANVSNVDLDAGGTKYSTTGSAARTNLVNNKGWTINDGGQI